MGAVDTAGFGQAGMAMHGEAGAKPAGQREQRGHKHDLIVVREVLLPHAYPAAAGRQRRCDHISERPAAAELRSEIGHWEIDTVIGTGDHHCLVTVVDRKTGYLAIGKLRARTKEHTIRRTLRLMRRHPQRFKTITADNGTEFHMYKALEQRLNTTIYFATPHHAWERGTNENTNGLLRQYLPKRTDLSALTQRQCTALAAKLNDRPRRRLGFRTPSEVYHGISDVPRRWAASCGKLFGSCPRKRPIGCPESDVSTSHSSHPSPRALQI